jgi:hypothetical protein
MSIHIIVEKILNVKVIFIALFLRKHNISSKEPFIDD